MVALRVYSISGSLATSGRSLGRLSLFMLFALC